MADKSQKGADKAGKWPVNGYNEEKWPVNGYNEEKWPIFLASKDKI